MLNSYGTVSYTHLDVYKRQDEAALKIQNVYADLLPADLKGIYNTICNTTGTTGIEGTTDPSCFPPHQES